jgi:ectoine hydroxylase-related dioxygenase (phytanoyl-CoA dioxygenase family)
MGLDGWTNALLMVVLFSDITPRGGGTLLACDSPALVARRLAEGEVDFTTNDELKTIVRRCSDFQEVEGKAGDMLLLHPFLVHSATKNYGDRVRILANPMLESRTPLNFATGARVLSPLEEITQSWLR